MQRRGRLVGFVLAALLVSSGTTLATLSIYLAPEDLAERAPVVVRGTVLESRCGFDPVQGTLATYVTLRIHAVLRGPDDLDQIVLREPGGVWGDLIHRVDAVPRYLVGEEVVAFLEPSRDGALRTAGMFFGKYHVVREHPGGPAEAVRQLDGNGTILRRPPDRPESFPLRDLRSLVAGTRAARRVAGRQDASHAASSWSPQPPEFDRLRWAPEPTVAPRLSAPGATTDWFLPSGTDDDPISTRFTTLSSSNPSRWYEADSGTPVTVHIERERDPLGDGAASVAEIERALDAWTGVGESRLVLQAGNTDVDFTIPGSQSPAVAYPPYNVVLFGDPYDDISDPSGCSGTLAIGGYWASGSTGGPINGVTYHRALRLHVTFNNGFECFLGNPDNLAEVATHEIGHGIGLGHSAVADAIMRSSAYGYRGPRLGDDDLDAAHCVYPHTLDVTYPDGQEILSAGSTVQIHWTSTSEAGPDAGEVDLDYSGDSGATWNPIASGQPNDGAFDWTVPSSTGDAYRVRVSRPNRVQPAPAPYPDRCSGAASEADFSVASNGIAGTIPGGDGLLLGKSGADVVLSWSASCSDDADDFAVYEGSLTALRSGSWDPAPVSCSAGVDRTHTLSPGYGRAYYLVAPLAGSAEGSLGSDGAGLERAEPSSTCGAREESSSCP